MKKIFILITIMIIACGFSFGKRPAKAQDIEVLPLISSESTQQNRLWVGTFQLVWNDLIDYIVKAPIKFYGGTPNVVKELNKKDFSTDYLSEDSYYKDYGKASPEMKNRIKKGIKEKFNETSDIIDSLDWSPAKGKYVIYAMLKKDFKFLEAFDKLKPEKFGNSSAKVDYFGIDANSNYKLYKNVEVLFYNSYSDFAVKLKTKSNDIVYLYRTSDDKTFDKLYDDMNSKAAKYNGKKYFRDIDRLKVPDIKLYQVKSFDEVCNRHIIGTNLEIAKAIETVDFKMNNEGVKLKSEAVIMTKLTSAGPGFRVEPRYFYFNDTFVLFLQEQDKTKPYFALRVADAESINKTAKK